MSQAQTGVQRALSFVGKLAYANSPSEYHNFVNRCVWPFPEHKTDCSGFPTAILHGMNVPTPSFSMSSASYAVWGHESGSGVDVGTALSTPFCLVIKGPDQGEAGFGDLGHIAITVGDGRIVEAQGHATGVVVGPYRAEFVYFMRVPGMTYLDMPTPTGETEMQNKSLARVENSAGVWLVDGYKRRALNQGDIDFLTITKQVDGVIWPIDPNVLQHLAEEARA